MTSFIKPTTGDDVVRKTFQPEDDISITSHLRECCLANENDNIKEYRKQLCKEFADNITLHGYRQLVTEPGWRKVIWIIIMAG